MEYNTQRNPLHVREYGRNTQLLVDKLCQIENPDTRLKIATQTVEMLRNMNNQYKNSDNSDQKIWDMLYYISNFKLEVNSPYPPPPGDNFEFTPRRLNYTSIKQGKKHAHLGKNIIALVKITESTEDPIKKSRLVRLIAHYMRVAYLTWHDELPNDDHIANEITKMSNGLLQYDATTSPKTNHYAQLVQQKQQQQKFNAKSHKKRK